MCNMQREFNLFALLGKKKNLLFESLDLKGRTIAILGNGFDLDVGLPTSYNQFVDSSSFEKYMSLQGKDVSVECDDGTKRNYSLMRYVYEAHTHDRWVDLELLLAKYALNTRILIQSKEKLLNTPNVSNAEIRIMYGFLVKALAEYLGSISYDSVKADSNASCLLRYISNRIDVEIWNFNYTNLNRLCVPLAINKIRCRIVHVHGSLEGEIILGFHNDANVDKSFNYMKKIEHPNHEFTGYISKLQEAKNVVVFGHSLGETDKDYFTAWLNELADGKIIGQNLIIYTKDDNSVRQICSRINEMTGNRLNTIKGYNTITFKKSM